MRILLEMKARGLMTRIEPLVDQLSDAGLWMTADIRQRILALLVNILPQPITDGR